MNALDTFADLQRWVVWRNEPREDDSSKLTKVPYQAANGRKASSRLRKKSHVSFLGTTNSALLATTGHTYCVV